MSLKIGLIGARIDANFGGPSLAISTIKALKHVLPDSEFTLFIPNSANQSSITLFEDYDVKLIESHDNKFDILFAILKQLTGLTIGNMDSRQNIINIKKMDIIVDIWGIMYTDSLNSNSFKRRFREGLRFVVYRILGKKVIKYSSDFGPISSFWNRFFARYYLKRYIHFILVRNKYSYKELRSVQINTPIEIVPDTAFILEKVNYTFPQELLVKTIDRSLIGISVSFQVNKRSTEHESYIETIVKLVKHIVNSKEMSVVLIPNELSSSAWDDMYIANKIFKLVDNDYCFVLDTKNLGAGEIKGIISKCDALIASRYHSVVASLSLSIPTLVIGWHYKYLGVLELFNLEEWLIDINDLSYHELVDRFNAFWAKRGEIKQRITQTLPEVINEVYSGAKKVREFILNEIESRQ